jgi:hypothetical protein
VSGEDRWWQYVDGDAPGDGRAWLANPSELFGFIDFRATASPSTFRIMVATRAFVDRALRDLQNGTAWTVFAAMLVVPDGDPEVIDAAVATAVNAGGLEHFAAKMAHAPNTARSSSRPAV